MKALIFLENDDVRLQEAPDPEILDPQDAVVRVTTSSICTSDLHVKKYGIQLGVRPGTIIGHEFVGVVDQLGPRVTGFTPGDRVAVSCIFSCGQCLYCQKGLASQCSKGAVFGGAGGVVCHGAQAEKIRVPFASRGMHKIPDSLTDRQVLFVGDILSTGLFGVQQAGLEKGDTLAVVGAGPVGMCAMLMAKMFEPARIIAIEMNPHRKSVVLKQGLADQVIDPQEENPRRLIKEMTKGRGADAVIDAVGSPSSSLALDLVRPGGNVSLIGVYTEPLQLPMQQHWWRNLTIKTGLVETSKMDWLIRLIDEGRLDTGFLITHYFSFKDLLEGYEVMEDPSSNALKVMIEH